MDAGHDAAPDTGPPDAGTDAGPDPIFERPALDTGNTLPETDERYEGQLRFLWDAWGTEILDQWPPADFMLALMTEEPEVFGNQYESFGFIPDPDDDFPIGFKRGLDDPTRVHETCALCHVARLPDGTLWMGAPNRNLDFGRFHVEVNNRWVAAGNPSRLTPNQERKALLLGPGRTGAETHDYPDVVPADFPPYFRMNRHSHMNYLGTGRDVRTEVYLSIFTFGAGNPNPRDAEVPFPARDHLTPFVMFLGSLEAPPAPAGDAAMIAAGRAVFVRERCIDCHHDNPMENGVSHVIQEPGTVELFPGDDPMYPDGLVLTDFAHRVIQEGDGMGMGVDEGFVDLLNFIIMHGLEASMSVGYRIPDLVGLWATAPYLHNGAVPTLEDLLRPAADRPSSYLRGDFLVDTTLHGNSNMGHEYGTAINETDRTALAAYLLSL
jgi:hypothetical protein